jgi:hypothetical protein
VVLEIGDPSGRVACALSNYHVWYIVEPNKNEAVEWKENIHFIEDFFDETLPDIGSAISETWKDTGKILDKYVVKPIEKDPWGFIVTAAAASFGIPYIVGPGMIASGIASTAVSLSQGKDFDDALTDGVTAAVLDFGISEGFNVLKGSPKPFGSSANIGAQFDATPTFESMFGDAAPTKTVTNQLDDSLNLNRDFTSAMPENQVGALDLNKELDFNPQQFDEMAALRPDEIAAMNEGSYFNDPYPNETYLNDDGMLGFDRGQYAAYTEPAPRLSDIYPEPKNYLSDISTNELGALPDSGTYKAPIVDMGTKATKEVADITASDWWKHPVDTLGKYTEDKIGVDITNPWIVGGAGLGLSYLQKKKAADEERRRREEAARNDPLNSPLFTSRLQQYKYERIFRNPCKFQMTVYEIL